MTGKNTPILQTLGRLCCTLLLFIGSLSTAFAEASGNDDGLPAEIDFDLHIRPILSDRCFKCHGPDEVGRKADLRLDTREGILESAVVEGDPDASELIARLHSTDEDEIMPPPETGLVLSDREKALLAKWVEDGVAYDEHWAYEPLKKPEAPAVKHPWVRNDIDRFILDRLQREGIPPSPAASKHKLARRVHFGLTGLPPTPDELAENWSDDERIDTLLARPAYGERMATHWLDIARYSDSYGYQVDRNRYVWPWRDWVIGAFNDNLPYDDFLTWQLAGDLLENPTKDQILATTFNRLHPQKVEGGSVPEEFRVEYVADRTHTFGTAFLGLTLECARCHDHKYDPITAKDYYQFFAYFNSIDEAGLYSYFTPSIPTPTLALTSDNQNKQLADADAVVAGAEATLAKALTDAESAKDDAPDSTNAVLLAYYRFDEEKHGKHKDQTGQQAEATTGGENRTTDGEDGRGKALLLTGDDAVQFPLGNFRRHEPWTVAIRVNTPDLKDRAVIFHRSKAWTDAASRGYQLLIEEGKLSASLIHFWPGNAIRVRTLDVLPTNAWHHIAVTYDGSSHADGLSIWVDGKRAKTEVVRDNLTKAIIGGGNDNLHIGERMRDRGFKFGKIDDFAVANHILAPVQIAALAKGVDPEKLPRADESEVVTKARANLLAARKKRNDLQNGQTEIMVMRELPEPRPTFILNRGLYTELGEPVVARTPDWLPNTPTDADGKQTRLDLAKWLLDPEHPLTTRVFVNRIWQMHMGEGLVRTPEDFGSQGARPTHPALLDWLCTTFIESGWDIKALHKLILQSATYRQHSITPADLLERDPENKLLARAPIFRWPAEMIRDNALAVSGLLDRKLGGNYVIPYDQKESFKPNNPNHVHRRSLYTYWRRTGPSPLMMAFDASKRDVCTVKRERTDSPLQSLALLNGPQFVEAARSLAETLVDSGNALPQAFLLLTSREPTAKQAGILQRMLDAQREHFKATPEDAAKVLAIGKKKRASKAEDVELAALTNVILTLFSYDESVMHR